MPIPLPLAVFIESTGMFVVFASMCRIKFRILEALVVIFVIALGLFALVGSGITHYIMVVLVQIMAIAIMTLVAHHKINHMSLSFFFAVSTSLINIFFGSVATVILYPIFTTLHEHVNHTVVMGDLALYLSYTILVFLMSFVFAWNAGRFFKTKVQLLDEGVKKALLRYLCSGVAITLVAFFMISFLREIITGVAPTLIYTLSLTVSFILIVLLALTFVGSLSKEASLRNLREYARNVEMMAAEIKKFRHDHKDLMLGFYEHLKNENINGANEYYQKYMVLFNKNAEAMEANWNELSHLPNSEIRSIISYKLTYAQQLGINVTINVMEDVKTIDRNHLVDICRILGIFLNNAIEACTDVKGAELQFGILNKGPLILFVVKNTCEDSIDIDKLNLPDYTTKEGARGLGLNIVSQIVEANQQLSLTTKVKDGYFVQMLAVIP